MLKANTHLRHAQKINPIVFPDNLREADIVLGQVVDLAFVDSDPPKLAEVISWAATGYMHALVVANDIPRREGYFRDQNVSFWELDRIAPYQSPKGKNRSENQRSQQKIPLELPRITGHISGNPRHLVCLLPYSTSHLSLSLSLFRQVNLIHLHPKDEKLRDTIFYQIFQNSLLLDKETDAVIYRNLLIQNKIFPIPNLYSLDGVCLRGDGLFHPTQDRLPGKLNYIFGEKSVTDLSEFRNLDRELNLIQEIKSFLQQENEICLQKSQRENAINELHEEIERIENRHGMKRRKRIRKASELMYEEMHEEEEEEREGEEGCSLSQHNRKKRTHK
jgi:hypothetical protein